MEGYRTVIKQTEIKEDKAYQLLSDSMIDEETYQRQVATIRSEKRKYEDLLEEGQLLIASKFYETSDRIIELPKDAESLWKVASDEEKLSFLKLVLSNQTLNTCVDKMDAVTIDYKMIEPLSAISDIKKAHSKAGFFNDSKRWCPDVEEYRTALLDYYVA